MFSRLAPAGRRTALLASFATGALLLASTLLPQNVKPVMAAPIMRMPFLCGQTWIAKTYAGHEPSNYSIDFNRDNDLGDAVIASAGGTVTTVANLGGASYGRYIIISHSGGWNTLYAHLSDVRVSQGQSVSMGQRIGSVGSTGNSTGPHLHYEQRIGTTPQPVVLGSTPVIYFSTTQTYTSQNGC